jgi:hypothetical protein
MSTSNDGNAVTLTTGLEVVDANGDKVGKIIEVTEETIAIEKGFFFPKDYVIPLSLVAGVNEDDQVVLTLPKDEVKEYRATDLDDAALATGDLGVVPDATIGGAFAAGGPGFGGMPIPPIAIEVPATGIELDPEEEAAPEAEGLGGEEAPIDDERLADAARADVEERRGAF